MRKIKMPFAPRRRVTKRKRFPLWAVEDPQSYGMNRNDEKRAWQKLVNSGMAWKLQGWYGRTASGLIEAGIIKLPKRKK